MIPSESRSPFTPTPGAPTPEPTPSPLQSPPTLDQTLNELVLPSSPPVSKISYTVAERLSKETKRPELVVKLSHGTRTANLVLHDGDLNRISDQDRLLVLYLPGLAETVFNPFVKHREEDRDFAFVSLDLNSEHANHPMHLPSLQKLIESAELALSWLCELRQDRVAIAGFSLGGCLAVRLAESHADKISAITLFSPSFLQPQMIWLYNNVLLRGMALYNGAVDGVRGVFGRSPRAPISPDTYPTLREFLDPASHERLFKNLNVPTLISISQREGFSQPYFETLMEFLPPDKRSFLAFVGSEHSPDHSGKIDAALAFIARFG